MHPPIVSTASDQVWADNTIRGLVRCTQIACFTLGIAPEIMPA
jgi:hypothetical protein